MGLDVWDINMSQSSKISPTPFSYFQKVMDSKLYTMECANMDPPQNFFSFHSAQDQDRSGGQFDEA